MKKLIASCYIEQQFDLFSLNSEISNGFYYEYTGKKEEVIIPSLNDVTFFKGDGDFRSEESMKLLKEADVVVTNPPFSLFRDFLAQVVQYDKQFLIIGNINAITYKETFKLIENNKVWMGINMGRGNFLDLLFQTTMNSMVQKPL